MNRKLFYILFLLITVTGELFGQGITYGE